MTRCNLETLSRYLDGDLTLPARIELEQHLRTCLACREELMVLRSMDRKIVGWGAVRKPIPAQTETGILTSVGKKRKLRPILALSRMMPAALGSCIAAVLVLMSANLGWFYQNGPSMNSANSGAHVQRILESRSQALQNARRSSAILGGRSVVYPEFQGRHRSQLGIE